MAMNNRQKRLLHMKVQDLASKIKNNGDGAAANELYDMILMKEDDLETVLAGYRVQLARTRENHLLDLETATARARADLDELNAET
jgi:hypothetical protein